MKILGVAALVLMASVVVLADGVPTTMAHVPHDKAAETFVKGGSIVNDKGLVMLASWRGAGEVEVHEKTNHIFIVIEGEAFITGGALVGARQTAPGQTRAAKVEGGTTHHLTKGDVITVPAKTPHWFKDVPTKTIAYYTTNLESQERR